MLNIVSINTCTVQSQLTFDKKNCVFIYCSTQYMKIRLQKMKKTDYALVPLLKIKGTKRVGKSPQF